MIDLISENVSTIPIEILYQNHRGVRDWRRIRVCRIYFGYEPNYHPEKQLLVEAWAYDRGAIRTFAAASIEDVRVLPTFDEEVIVAAPSAP